MSEAVVVVVVAENSLCECSEALARRLSLPLVFSQQALPENCNAWLGYADKRLQLHPADARQSGPIAVDFVAGATARRADNGAELIVKAVRGRSKQPLAILDATAGLGRDSFVLASRGFAVTLLERNAIIAALLADGLERAATAELAIADIAARMYLINVDAKNYFSTLLDDGRPDVIYLDPMFPSSQKSALVKKEMRLFQQLLHDDNDDATALLQAARKTARLRVVVKRPAKAEPLTAEVPSYAVIGKAIRFDIYACGA